MFEAKTYLFLRVEKKRTKATTWLIAGSGGESTETMTNLFFRCGEEENKGDDMAIAGSLFMSWRRRE